MSELNVNKITKKSTSYSRHCLLCGYEGSDEEKYAVNVISTGNRGNTFTLCKTHLVRLQDEAKKALEESE